MPTAARLISSIFLIGLAWFVSDMVMAAMLEENEYLNFGNFKLINLGIAALVGWRILGSRIGNVYSVALGIGLTAVAALVFWCLFAHSVIEMLKQSMDRRYDGPMEAVMGAVEFGVEYAGELARADIALMLVGGGIVAGLLTEFVSRRWS